MNHRRRTRLVLALTRRERAELSELRIRIGNVRRVLNRLEARRNFILSRVPDHMIVVPNIPVATVKPPIQPSLF